MPHRRGGLAQRQGGWHLEELVWVRDEFLRAWAFSHLQDELPTREDPELPRSLAHLYHRACYRCLRWEAVMYTIVGNVPIPTDAALLRPKALPGKVGGQRRQVFVGPASERHRERGAMEASIDLLTPGEGLPIEIIQIGEGNARPETVLDDADTSFDLPATLGASAACRPAALPQGRP